MRRRRERDRPAAVNLNITEIEDLTEDVGRNLITKDGQLEYIVMFVKFY